MWMPVTQILDWGYTVAYPWEFSPTSETWEERVVYINFYDPIDNLSWHFLGQELKETPWLSIL